MKKRVLCICCLLAVLLSGCRTAAEVTEGVAAQYENPVTAQVKITAICGVYAEYTLRCTCGGGTSTVELLEPQGLQGVKATIQSDACTIQYEGLELETLMPGVRGFTPVDAFDQSVYSLTRQVPSQYIYEERNGKKAVGLVYEGMADADTCSKTLWLAEDSLELLAGEYYLDGTLIMRLEVEQLEWAQPAP